MAGAGGGGGALTRAARSSRNRPERQQHHRRDGSAGGCKHGGGRGSGAGAAPLGSAAPPCGLEELQLERELSGAGLQLGHERDWGRCGCGRHAGGVKRSGDTPDVVLVRNGRGRGRLEHME